MMKKNMTKEEKTFVGIRNMAKEEKTFAGIRNMAEEEKSFAGIRNMAEEERTFAGIRNMTEEEKIFAGMLFDARTKELRDKKHKAHELCRRFNQMDEYDEERLPMVRKFIGAIGKKYYFQGPIQFNYGSHTYIGENFFANFNLTVMDDAKIHIGDNVMFGPNVSLMATNHPLIPSERCFMKYPDGHVSMSEFCKGITIGNNVWIACNVVVLDGVTIGDGAVIGAGSVVTKDIPAGYLACGVPCRPMRPITEADSKMALLYSSEE